MIKIVLVTAVSAMFLIPIGQNVYASADETVSNSSTELENIMKQL